MVIFKFLGDQRQLNLLKNRFFSKEIDKITAAENLSEKLAHETNPQSGRPYIMIQKNYDTLYKRLLRIDIFSQNIICFMDDTNSQN